MNSASHKISSHELLELSGIQFNKKLVSDFPVKEVVCDSRKCTNGVVFVAIRGMTQDGHAFIPDALKRGAQLVIAQDSSVMTHDGLVICVTNSRRGYAMLNHHLWGAPARTMKLLGITGTNGKTTSAFLTHAILSRRSQTGLMGTIHHQHTDRRILSTQTTLDPEALHPLLREMSDAKCDTVVMEVSSHALHQDRLAGLTLDAVLFTNFSQDHLDYHLTMEAYFEAKVKVLDLLKEGGRVILNYDEPAFVPLQRRDSQLCFTYGCQEGAQLRAMSIRSSLEGSVFDLVYEGRSFSIRTSLLGRHNVYNIVGAVSLALSHGIPIKECITAVEGFDGVPGRLERISTERGFELFIDYAHTEDGLDNVLRAVKPFVKGRLLLLFGCGGDRDSTKRPKMAEIAEQFADACLITSDNPRSENPRAIAKEICAGFSKTFTNYEIELDRRKALKQMLLEAKPGDAVLIAGKGHESVQIIGDEKHPFSDREECLRILKGR